MMRWLDGVYTWIAGWYYAALARQERRRPRRPVGETWRQVARPGGAPIPPTRRRYVEDPSLWGAPPFLHGWDPSWWVEMPDGPQRVARWATGGRSR